MEIKSVTSVDINRIVGVIVGPSGIGKTTLAASLEGRTLIGSAESGLLCLKKFPNEVKENIDFVEIKTIKDFVEFFEYVESKKAKEKYQNIFIDSLTEIGEVLLKDLKKDPQYSGQKDMFKLYGKLGEMFSWFVKELRDMSPYNVWFTCLNAFEKDGVEMVEVFNFPGQKSKDNLKGWIDLVLKYEVFEDEKGEKFRKLISDVEINPLAKDRSGLLESYEDAHLGQITNKILG